MSKSLKRVRAALESAGETPHIRETELARTAMDAANAVGCDVDQIAKSIIFVGAESGRAILFVTAGGNRVDAAKATELAGEPLAKAEASLIREQTGFAIGGVSPIGHLTPSRTFLDTRLQAFDLIWAAAGTPHHVFSISPDRLKDLTGADFVEFTE